jgi:hypothetical protein
MVRYWQIAFISKIGAESRENIHQTALLVMKLTSWNKTNRQDSLLARNPGKRKFLVDNALDESRSTKINRMTITVL